MTFKNIAAGDEVWVVNGRETSVFEANVVEVSDDIITVNQVGKDGRLLDFRRSDGVADADPQVSQAFLAFDGDSRVTKILNEKEQGYWHSTVMKRASVFRKNPTASNIEALESAILSWKKFVAENFGL